MYITEVKRSPKKTVYSKYKHDNTDLYSWAVEIIKLHDDDFKLSAMLYIVTFTLL